MDSIIIAVSGKGGVGKTSVSAALVRLLTERHAGARILAIDADPAYGLATALGSESDTTLDSIRKSVAADVTGKLKDTQDILAEARFRLFDAMTEKNGFAFLAVGRPEASGCYCAVNTYLRQVIEMLAADFDYVVIDGEAGIEQINRRVMENVTHLVLISDQSRKGLRVVGTIKQVADELIMYKKAVLVLNRVHDAASAAETEVCGIKPCAVICPDDNQTENDMEGKTVFDLPDDSPILAGAAKILAELNI